MKIVAILDVDKQKFRESDESNKHDYINKFVGYMDYPKEDNDYIIISKDNMYGTCF